MIGALKQSVAPLPSIRVDVLEAGARTRTSSLPCVIDQNLKFSTESMESYFFAQWEPVVYDALLVAAAVEYCDRTQRRPAPAWGREIELRVPAHDPDRWKQKTVAETLHRTLDFLTGDRWQISFYPRKQPLSPPRQGQFRLSGNASAVIPFSDGLDSRAVAGLMARSLGDKLIRIRLGHTLSHPRQPFTAVPYKVLSGQRGFVESSARSRGFKFALIAGVAAYFANTSQIIVPESGQGALGPALLPVGQAYEDYRSHPLFTHRMEQFMAALLGLRVSFQFPQLWQTKGETLWRFVKECEDGSLWAETWSCLQQSRQVSVENKKRQCGICGRLHAQALERSRRRSGRTKSHLRLGRPGRPHFRGRRCRRLQQEQDHPRHARVRNRGRITLRPSRRAGSFTCERGSAFSSRFATEPCLQAAANGNAHPTPSPAQPT